MVDWTTTFGSGFTPPTPNPAGGLLGNPYGYMADLGFGLLANSGPSLQPQGGFGQALGRAGLMASERQDQQVLNEARRQQILESVQEQKQSAALTEYLAKGGKLTPEALLQFMPKEAVKGYIAAVTDPTLPIRQQAAEQQKAAAEAALPGTQAESELKGAEVASAKSDITQLYESASKASDAAEYLKTVPGGESIATLSDDTLKLFRKAKANNWDKSILGEWATYLTPVPREQWGQVLDAAEQLQKARAGISTLSPAANRAGAQGLQAKMTSYGEGAGLNLQSDLMSSAVEKTRAAAAGFRDYSLPEIDPKTFAWRQGPTGTADTGYKPPSVGFQNGQIVSQPPPVYRPLPTTPPVGPPQAPPSVRGTGDIPGLAPTVDAIKGFFGFGAPSPSTSYTPPPVPPAAPPAAASTVPPPVTVSPPQQGPTPRKVATTPIDPATGNPFPVFPRKADGARAVKAGKFIAPNDQGVPTIYEVY